MEELQRTVSAGGSTRRVFPDIDPESWNEEQGEVK